MDEFKSTTEHELQKRRRMDTDFTLQKEKLT